MNNLTTIEQLKVIAQKKKEAEKSKSQFEARYDKLETLIIKYRRAVFDACNEYSHHERVCNEQGGVDSVEIYTKKKLVDNPSPVIFKIIALQSDIREALGGVEKWKKFCINRKPASQLEVA